MIQAYEVTVKGTEWERVIHSTTAGKAKSEYFRELQDSWPDVPFTALRARCLGKPVQTEAFRRVAAYRRLPEARIGMAVRVEGHLGYIVGPNDSANFDVLFADGPFKGQVGNCHPHHKMDLLQQ